MNTLYDYQIFTTQKVGGVSRYFYEIMKGINQTEEVLLPLVAAKNLYLKEKAISNINYIPYNFQFMGSYHLIDKNVALLNQIKTISLLKQSDKYDIFHPTWYNPYFFEYCSKPFVTTIHDLIHERYYNKYKLNGKNNQRQIEDKKQSIHNANRIIAVSQYTKKDILEVYNIDPEKVDVIYHGAPVPPKSYSENRHGDYILFVGRRNGYKNFARFVEAMVEVMDENKELKLICVGGAFNEQEKLLLKKKNMLSRSEAMQVNDLILYDLYHHARLFVFPSLYEGFGIPILEAFVNGCPCCIAEATCFPEIADDAAEYFDPMDITSMKKAIKNVLYNESRRHTLIQKGQERVLQFNWIKATEQTRRVYEIILTNK